MTFRMLLVSFIAALVASAVVVSGQRRSWADSYSVAGKCYCSSTFDHGIGDVMVDGPNGRITMKKACDLVGKGPQGDRVYYNDIQCGNGPANNAPDEANCPGRVDLGDGNRSGCFTIGPKWLFPNSGPNSASKPSLAGIRHVGEDAGAVLTQLTVTDLKDNTSTPLGGSILLSQYPSGFSIRAEVSDPTLIRTVQFTSSSGYSRTETTNPFDMFGSTGAWNNPPTGIVVVTVVATKVDGAQETLEANIRFQWFQVVLQGSVYDGFHRTITDAITFHVGYIKVAGMQQDGHPDLPSPTYPG